MKLEENLEMINEAYNKDKFIDEAELLDEEIKPAKLALVKDIVWEQILKLRSYRNHMAKHNFNHLTSKPTMSKFEIQEKQILTLAIAWQFNLCGCAWHLIMFAMLEREGPSLAPDLVAIMELQPQTSRDTVDDGEDADANLKFLLHPNDPANFLKLCAALQILIRWKLSNDDISQAEQLISQYCGELIHCLIKVLKFFKSNNHAHGKLEMTFFREFQRTCQIGRLNSLNKMLKREAAKTMLKGSNDKRGTVATLAKLSQDLDDVNPAAQIQLASQDYVFSP
ncbi:hypothetical protein BDR06DRAFT_975895 [Suillus hirtellus]|nr:hypothetical protein BDR06DRAFT_975895 [Suillus hirtellus]